MMTENIMMSAVKAGGDRQELHERIRAHSVAAGQAIKGEGKANDLLQRIAQDRAFPIDRDQLEALARPELYIGRSREQVLEFLAERVEPLLDGVPFESNDPEIRV